MKNYFFVLIILLNASYLTAQEYSENRLIVSLKMTNYNQAGFYNFQRFNNENGAVISKQFGPAASVVKSKDGINWKRHVVLSFPETNSIESVLKKYDGSGFFDYVELDFKGKGGSTIPNDPIFSTKQYYHVNDGSFTGASGHPAIIDADMDTDLAWDITTGSDKVVLGVFDTGLKMDHQEFSGRFWTNSGEIPNNGIDDDNNGYVDDVNGYDFVNIDGDPTDDHAHGTNVTGIAAATGNNNFGMAGMDWNCKVMVLKVLDENNAGWYSDWSEALYYAADEGIDVANMSLYGTGYSSSLKSAVDYAHNKGVLVVVCMGNDNTGTAAYPAGYDNAMGVGAVNPDDTRVTPTNFGWGSNYGSHISVVAPGNVVYSTRYNNGTSFGYWMGGTSQATPQVAGLACLIESLDLGLSNTEIRTIIENSAQDQVGLIGEDVQGFDFYHGYGRINAYDALVAAQTLTSNKEVEYQDDMKIFPNPSSNSIYVSTKLNKELAVYSLTGSEVLTGISNQKLDISKLSPGLYFVKVEKRLLKLVVK